MREELCRFSGVNIIDQGKELLHNVNLYIARGELVGMCGLHDSGKSVLAKALCGMLNYDGDVYWSEVGGGRYYISEKSFLVPSLTVYENLFALTERKSGKLLFKVNEAKSRTKELLEYMGLSIEPGTRVSELDKVQMTLLHIVKAYANNAKLVVLDGVTETWNREELIRLYDLIRRCRMITFVYACSRQDSLLLKCDRVIIMRSRRVVSVVNRDSVSEKLLEKYEFGSYTAKDYYRDTTKGSKVVFKMAVPLRMGGNKSIEVREGEVVGVIDFNTYIGERLFALITSTRLAGVQIMGRAVRDFSEAVSCGVGFVDMLEPQQQIFSCFSQKENRAFQMLKRISSAGIMDSRLFKYIEEYSAEFPDGNAGLRGKHFDALQTVLCRWWLAKPKALIVNYAPSGYSPEEKTQITGIIDSMAHNGTGFLLILSELGDGEGICDRITTIEEGVDHV